MRGGLTSTEPSQRLRVALGIRGKGTRKVRSSCPSVIRLRGPSEVPYVRSGGTNATTHAGSEGLRRREHCCADISIHNIDNSKYAANKPVLVATNNMLITYRG